MYNWSHIDEEAMKKVDPEKYRKWRVIEMLNTDRGGEKFDRNEMIALWPKIKDKIEPYTRRAIEFLLWGTIYSLPINVPSWNMPRTRST